MTERSVAILGTRGYPSYYGGFETLVRKLTPFLAERGWLVTVYGREDAGAHNYHERIRVIRTSGIETKSASALTFGATAAAHAAFVRPSVALVMNVANGFWLPLLRARRVPTVVNVDGIEWEREKWGRTARSVFYAGAKMTAKHASGIVCDSRIISTRWSLEFGRTDGVYIPYGGSVPPPLPVEQGLTPGKYALLVSRFVPENTVNEFLDAVPHLKAAEEVVIVGSSGYGGPIEDRVRALARSDSRVKWLGQVRDDAKLFGLWQNAGAYFHGHSVGGTNPALVQAMACGAPIVARDTGFNREVLGNAAIFVRPTSGDIASGINALLESTERAGALGESAKRRAESDYSWEAVLARYEETLLRARSTA